MSEALGAPVWHLLVLAIVFRFPVISVLRGVHTMPVVCCHLQHLWEHVIPGILLLCGVFCWASRSQRIFWKLYQSSVPVPRVLCSFRSSSSLCLLSTRTTGACHYFQFFTWVWSPNSGPHVYAAAPYTLNHFLSL